MLRWLLGILLCLPLAAQRPFAGTPEIKQALDRLPVAGSVLMIAAHPDDENNAVLAYLARGRKLRTGYLSLTRGEGGQNLLGTEQGDALGVMRTQELLSAARVEGIEQYFTRAIDFGFSKTAEETIAKWGRDDVLADMVWVIRHFRPDVVILRFSGTLRDGHAHHQASGMLGPEAVRAAADPARFPEQLAEVKPWQVKRAVWNVFAFTREQEREAAQLKNVVNLELGAFDPVLGYSFAELGGVARSFHLSQGFGAAQRRGAMRAGFTAVVGDPAAQDLLDGVDATLARIPGSAAAARWIDEARRTFQPDQPHTVAPLLIKARAVLAALDDPWARRKVEELDDAIALCLGLWVDVSTDRASASPGSTVKLTTTIVRRSPVAFTKVTARGEPLSLPEAVNEPFTATSNWNIPADVSYSQPYWLRMPKTKVGMYSLPDRSHLALAENRPEQIRFEFTTADGSFHLTRPIHYRYVERSEGEKTRPFAIVPAVALTLAETAFVFPDAKPRPVGVIVEANAPKAAGALRLELPAGWKSEPAAQNFTLGEAGSMQTLRFVVTPPAAAAAGKLRAVAAISGRDTSVSQVRVEYPHIAPQIFFPPSEAALVRGDIVTKARRVGYLMGAGDAGPAAIRQLGCEVELLKEGDLERADLSRFDALVAGVRAFNTRADVRAAAPRLFDYVRQGGTFVVQYNVADRFTGGGELKNTGPFPLQIDRGRVVEEDSPVRLAAAEHPLLNAPNKITAADFEGWVQERGLYFASKWDDQYQPLFGMKDTGEAEQLGGTLAARVGKGVYIYTGLSLFRQLPAGVPGAYRLLANFLSGGR